MTQYLPVTTASAEKETGQAALPAKTGRTGNIMIVDDEPSIREMACEALQVFGYKTVSFGKAGKAIDHYRKQHGAIDLVILDLSMPEMNGDDCFRAMKAINPAIRAIVSSGHAMDHEIGTLLAEGVSAFLPKPFDLDKLSDTVRMALG